MPDKHEQMDPKLAAALGAAAGLAVGLIAGALTDPVKRAKVAQEAQKLQHKAEKLVEEAGHQAGAVKAHIADELSAVEEHLR